MIKLDLNDAHMEPIAVLLLEFQNECKAAWNEDKKKGLVPGNKGSTYYHKLPGIRIKYAKKIVNECASVIDKNTVEYDSFRSIFPN